MDANTIALIGGLVAGLGGWLWREVRGDANQSLSDLVSASARAAWSGLVASYGGGSIADFQARVESAVTAKVWSVALAHGFTRNATTEIIATTIIHEAIGDATEALQDAINAQVSANLAKLAKITADTSATVDEFTKG